MPKSASKKYVLVSFEKGEDSMQDYRRLRRYLGSHKMEYICSSDPEEIREYIDKLHDRSLTFDQVADEQLDDDTALDTTQPEISTFSNQEILEQWARGAFAEGSDAINLLLGTSSTQESNEQEMESTAFDIPQLFTVHSIESEAPNDPEIGKEDNQTLAFCGLCDTHVHVGRNRNTKIRRHAQHVIDCHLEEDFVGVEIERRYQCLQCHRTLPVSKSPCDHISDYHSNKTSELEFRDLWTKEQVSAFNSVLEKCFEKHLPVPRSRRMRPGDTWISEQKAYRIVQGNDVLQIDAVAEKPRTNVEKNASLADAQRENKETPTTPSIVIDQDVSSLSDDEPLFIHDDIDSKDIDIDINESDHDYFKDDRRNAFDKF